MADDFATHGLLGRRAARDSNAVKRGNKMRHRGAIWTEAAFARHLQESPIARSAIEKLICETCPRNLLMTLLRLAARPDRKRAWNEFVQWGVAPRRRVEKVATLLTQACHELKELATAPLGLILLGAPEINEAWDLAVGMERAAYRLQRLHSVSAKASRVLSYRAAWKHVPIALLAVVIKRRAGSVPWGDLAYALEAVSAGYGVEAILSPDGLRREHERFVLRPAGRAFYASGLLEFLLSFSGGDEAARRRRKYRRMAKAMG